MMREKTIRIGERTVGEGRPAYIIAEMSANHNQNFDRAVAILRAAKEAGADAIKLQTYKPETITFNSRRRLFTIDDGSVWAGESLYDLYARASTPWEWHAPLRDIAVALKMDFFSSPFDTTAVAFLETLDVPAYKIASCELVDIQLLQTVARTGKPVIISTGMADLSEIEEAVVTVRAIPGSQLALLKCTSSYPAPTAHMNLRAIPFLSERFSLPVGLSDHSMALEVPVAAVSLGACIIEKHLTLSRSDDGADSSFSLEPEEFGQMVRAVREAEKAMGSAQWQLSDAEKASRGLRRSLFVVADMQPGDTFTTVNVRSIRPGQGLHTRYLESILGKKAAVPITPGTPLSWSLIADQPEAGVVFGRDKDHG